MTTLHRVKTSTNKIKFAANTDSQRKNHIKRSKVELINKLQNKKLQFGG
ncbi:hypothetical Protein psc1_04950 [Candidatus Phytoplasma solani]|nr:hypothetical protein S231_01070 [Candidatus Phytoplasma solani]